MLKVLLIFFVTAAYASSDQLIELANCNLDSAGKAVPGQASCYCPISGELISRNALNRSCPPSAEDTAAEPVTETSLRSSMSERQIQDLLIKFPNGPSSVFDEQKRIILNKYCEAFAGSVVAPAPAATAEVVTADSGNCPSDSRAGDAVSALQMIKRGGALNLVGRTGLRVFDRESETAEIRNSCVFRNSEVIVVSHYCFKPNGAASYGQNPVASFEVIPIDGSKVFEFYAERVSLEGEGCVGTCRSIEEERASAKYVDWVRELSSYSTAISGVSAASSSLGSLNANFSLRDFSDAYSAETKRGTARRPDSCSIARSSSAAGVAFYQSHNKDWGEAFDEVMRVSASR